MKITVRWRVLWGVLKDAKPVWIALCGLIGAYLLGRVLSALLSTDISARLRYTGMFLQLLGMINVAVGLRDMRRLFNRPSLGARAAAWFRALASAFTVPKPATMTASVSGAFTATGELSLVVRAAPNEPLERRVSILEQNLERLREEYHSKSQQLRQDLGEAKRNIEKESQERQATDAKLDRTIQEVAVGGLHLELIGLLWLIVGTLASTIPDEIVRLLK